MKKVKGFTLIELLIVVAIIAILAAIAVPNFLEAQVRAKVSRAKTDMRSVSIAIESYMIDTNQYPMSWHGTGGTINSTLELPAQDRETFAVRTLPASNDLQTVTTPQAYMTSLPRDPFADTRGCGFGYINADDSGWIMWSYGPNTDEKPDNGDIQAEVLEDAKTRNWGRTGETCTIYCPYTSNPLISLILIYTYNPTNGTTSDGDVWRIKD